MAKTFLTYFDNGNAAQEVKRRLQTEIFVVAVKQYATDMPDSNLSVSALMVGSMPNLAQGIFGTGATGQKGAYLLIVLDEDGHEETIKKMTEQYGGTVIKTEN
ncbi:MAG: hypothetical protein GX357_09680 [Firmicutes bacterium]|nr:hypothetical protein [Bacillota bacterium]